MTSGHSSLPPAFQGFKPVLTVHSPGRINLIGEHTDYNEGFVLPSAIDKGIRFQFCENGSGNRCNIYSASLQKSFSLDLREISRSEHIWENYILGVISEIQKRGKVLRGFDCVLSSNLPTGAGVSSSAALECGMAFGLNALFGLSLDRQTLAELSRDAEHNYVGTKCGIMDQYASLLSKKDHLMLLDCRNLDTAYIPADFKDYKLILMNTMVTHRLAEGQYNLRRAQCEQVVEIAQKKSSGIRSLRDLDFEMLDRVKSSLSELQYRRALYVLQENDRVLQSVVAMKKGNLREFGNLMYDSHVGLRDDYEVSCPELDFLVDFSKDFDCVLGARMMGGGFGGCTINLVKAGEVTGFIAAATEAYLQEFNFQMQSLTVLPEEGTKIIQQ